MSADARRPVRRDRRSVPSPVEPIGLVEDPSTAADADPGLLMLTCANCGATMDERKCKLICRCGYFLSCSDYY